MKTMTKKFLFIIFAADLLMMQTNNAASQTNNTNSIEYQINPLPVPRLTNGDYSLAAKNRMTNWARDHGISPSELFTNAEAYARYRNNIFTQRHGMTPSQAASNTVAYYSKPWTKEWPEPSKNKERFKHFAEILRDAIDTNQVEMVSNKLKNQPEAAFVLKEVLNGVHSSLNELANVLETVELKAYVGKMGYTATGSNSVNRFYFSFWSESGPFRGVDKRTLDAKAITMSVEFNENGKLSIFDRNDGNKEHLNFYHNGEFWSFSMILNGTNICVSWEGFGNTRVEKHNLKPVIKP